MRFQPGFIHPSSFPVVAGSVASTGGGEFANSHPASLPAGIQAGDLLLLFVNWSGSPGTVTIPGWSNIGPDAHRKLANGSEGTTVLIETSEHVLPGGLNAYRILGSTESEAVKKAVKDFRNSDSYDELPPSFPFEGPARNYLFGGDNSLKRFFDDYVEGRATWPSPGDAAAAHRRVE